MLPTDWGPPGTSVLAHMPDRRVRQFWDPDHLVAAAIRKAADAGKLQPECCDRNGVLWDLIAAFPPGAEWQDSMPKPILLNGPVVDKAAELTAILAQKP